MLNPGTKSWGSYEWLRQTTEALKEQRNRSLAGAIGPPGRWGGKIDALLREAGFRVDRLQNSRIPGPRTHTFFYEGRATP
ncbi:MAG TPA: hypothetical protein VGI23_15565 [Steroidobacteraceae bacterium]|jgi:hypothetical protein